MSNLYTLERQITTASSNIYQDTSKSKIDKIVLFPLQNAKSATTNALTEQIPLEPIQLLPNKSLENYDNDAVVEAYIRQFPFLESILLEAYQHILSVFGESFEKIVLKVVHDPEIPNYEHLVGYVWSNNTVEEARKLLDEFNDSWYLSLDYHIRRIIYFTIRTKK